MISFGSIALKVVLLYAKVLVRIIIVFYLATGIVMVGLTLLAGFLAEDSDTRDRALYSLVYQVGLNGPTQLMLWPLLLYISELQRYIEVYYPNLLNIKPFHFLQMF
jgi:hypothetical protein